MNASLPVCFMIMPYGKKKVDAAQAGIAEIDFDMLWDRALRPAIELLGYEPVRADQDIGALIIHEMLERLYFSDLVLAEMTVPNGNVYYEVGIRHACSHRGCVLLAADWSRQLFDVAQLRTVRYPMPQGVVDDAAAASIRAVIAANVPALANGASPMFQVLPGFPTNVDAARASVMRRQLDLLSAFQARLSAIRVAPKEQRPPMIEQVIAEYVHGHVVPAPVAHGVLKMLETQGDWQRIIDLTATLPQELAQSVSLIELVNLARSKLGDHVAAIAALERLIRDSGATSEREGLIAGRYKRLFVAASGAQKSEYLNLAIKHYERGMMLDLNDYYPSSNLPRLYRARAMKGDEDKARAVAQVVYYGCRRAQQQSSQDEWLRNTLLGAAFDAGDAAAAEELVVQIMEEGAAAWKLQAAITDCEMSLQYVATERARTSLAGVLDQLRQLL
jgi:hypothetical protein